MTNDITVMVAVVEEYIYQRKGVRVKINMSDSRKFVLHFEMLLYAYEIAVAYNKKTKT
jgi:hypothetical protein